MHDANQLLPEAELSLRILDSESDLVTLTEEIAESDKTSVIIVLCLS